MNTRRRIGALLFVRSVASIVLTAALSVPARAAVSEADFGAARDGATVHIFTLTNTAGAEARIMEFGSAIVSLKVPDRAGKLDDIVLGYDTLAPYLRNNRFFGAIVGRYGNRIGGAKFTLDGTEYPLAANNGRNTLHGGRRGFDKVVWTGKKVGDNSVEFTYLSKDGEEGFPGNLTVHVRYTLSDAAPDSATAQAATQKTKPASELKIEYTATTDKDTVINLTNHSFFNLAGAGSGDVLAHEVTIDADKMLEGDAGLIPTGKLLPVAGTPFDFTQAHKIGERIDAQNEQIGFGKGYDHCFVLNQKDGLRRAATVYEPTSGRVLELYTTQPAVQFYSANGLDSSIVGKSGKTYPRRSAFCLETEHFPDSPNHPDFPTTVLKKGDTFSAASVYKFSTK